MRLNIMHVELTKTLIENNILKSNMEIKARYYELGFSGVRTKIENYFFIHSIVPHKDNYIFEVKSIKDGTTKKIWNQSIIEIEGMHPERFAEIYKINPDGTKKSRMRKRGRPSKYRVITDEDSYYE